MYDFMEIRRMKPMTLEQIEKEMRFECDWCYHFASDPQYLTSRGNGQYEEIKFAFCPVCGRPLDTSKE
jgi:Pyruvate/2-oxoacid:ferredoxin oxidoreductase delta subunit